MADNPDNLLCFALGLAYGTALKEFPGHDPTSIAALILALLDNPPLDPMTTRAAPSCPPSLALTREDATILQALRQAFPVTLTQDEVSESTWVSLKSLRKRLAFLTDSGLVCYPHGRRQGCCLTTAGLQLADSLPDIAK